MHIKENCFFFPHGVYIRLLFCLYCCAMLLCVPLSLHVCVCVSCQMYSAKLFPTAGVCGFYRAMLCIRGTSHGPVSVCLSVRLSVRPSVTSRCSTKTAKRRITQTTPHDSPGRLVFCCQRSPRNSTGSPPTRSPNAGGVGQNRRLSTNIRLYLENGKR